MSFDICPKCGCNNAPMVWLGAVRGWICEDCYEKEGENEQFSDNNSNNLHHTCCNQLNK